MVDKNLAPVCGLFCGDCHFLGHDCSGCGHVQGKPFWTRQFNLPACPLHACCIDKKNLEHCGFCSELPCQAFRDLRDPSVSDEAFAASLLKRQDDLWKRAEVGTEAWLTSKIKTRM